MTGQATMTGQVTSRDGTRIAFERSGQGEPIIVVSGILCDRERARPLAHWLSSQLSVINYDRRGRGESSDTQPYAVQREVEDLWALIDEAGGSAAVYGHSSGAGLALHAAAAGLPITKLVLHEPPYSLDDEESRRAARELAEGVGLAVAERRFADAIALFMADSGLPAEMVEEMSHDPKMQELARTMHYDLEVMGDFTAGGAIPEGLVRAVSVPALVIAGGASPEFFRDVAQRVAELLADGAHTVLEGQDHGAPAEAVGPVVAEFVTGSTANAASL